MDASTELKNEIRKLRIDHAQRPDGPSNGPARITTGRSAPRSLRMPAVVLIIALLAAGGYLARGRLFSTGALGQRGAQEVRLITVAARADASTPPLLTATGKIVSDHKVQVATKVSGQIEEILFEQGDRVTQGQVIARIERDNYQARRDNAAAALERARARLAYAKANHDRVAGLHSEKNAGDIEFLNVLSEYEASRAQVDADAAALVEAQWWLDACEVRAPISGVVLQRNVEVGDFVAAQGGFGGMANAQFGAVADMSKLRVEVDVSEMDITRVTRGMPCVVTPDAYKDRRYPGHVMWLDPAANYSKATVQVKVRIENPDSFLRVEGTARVDFGTRLPGGDGATDDGAHAGPRVWLNRGAVLRDGREGAGAVFLYQDGRLRKTNVTIGRATDLEIEILSGLRPGDRVGADPAEYEDGQRVRLPEGGS